MACQIIKNTQISIIVTVSPHFVITNSAIADTFLSLTNSSYFSLVLDLDVMQKRSLKHITNKDFFYYYLLNQQRLLIEDKSNI